MTKLVCSLGLFLVLAPGVALAHGSSGERAARLDNAVEAAPNDHDVLVERAALELETGASRLAIADLERAAKLDAPASAAFERDLMLARAHLAAGDDDEAGAVIERLLAAAPGEPRALYVRARLREAAGEHVPAASDLALSIAGTREPAASAYLELAALHVAAGDDDLAIAALTTATDRLGALAVLIDEAVAIEIRRERFGQALAWSDRAEERLRVSPSGRARRAELLARLDRWAEAGAEASMGLAAVEALPSTRQSSVAVVATRAQLQATLDAARAQPAPNDAPPAKNHAFWVSLGAGLLLLAASAARRMGLRARRAGA